jgi:hypothetical protein
MIDAPSRFFDNVVLAYVDFKMPIVLLEVDSLAAKPNECDVSRRATGFGPQKH